MEIEYWWVGLTLLMYDTHAFPVLPLMNRMQLTTLGFELQEHLLYTGVSCLLWKYMCIKSLQVLSGKIGHASAFLLFGQEDN